MLARLERRAGLLFAAIGAVFALAYLLSMLSSPPRDRYVDGDAIQYYAYLRSLVFDRDLDFANDYERLYTARGGNAESNVWLRERTEVGRPRNMMSIGPALLWAPLYLTVVAAASAGAAVGVPVTVDGFAPPFPLTAGLAGIICATLGAYFCYRAVALRFSARAALWGTLLAWLASPAIYYSVISPAYSHSASLLTAALFVFLWLRSVGRHDVSRFAVLGAVAGLAMLVRWQAVTLLVLPVLELLASPARRSFAWSERIARASVLGALAALAFVPQLLAWNAIYGHYVVVPQGPDFMQWTSPALVDVLFSSRHGLFLWTPALVLAAVGLPLLWRRDRTLCAGAILVCVLSWYVNAAARDWWAGEAFGARRFVGETVFFAFGFAAFGSALARRTAASWLRAGALALIVYNGLFLLQYQLFMRGYRELSPYPTTVKQILIDRLLLPFKLLP
jgi:hypothetical protein